MPPNQIPVLNYRVSHDLRTFCFSNISEMHRNMDVIFLLCPFRPCGFVLRPMFWKSDTNCVHNSGSKKRVIFAHFGPVIEFFSIGKNGKQILFNKTAQARTIITPRVGTRRRKRSNWAQNLLCTAAALCLRHTTLPFWLAPAPSNPLRQRKKLYLVSRRFSNTNTA